MMFAEDILKALDPEKDELAFLDALKEQTYSMETAVPASSVAAELLSEPLEEARKTRRAAERTAQEVEKHTAQHDTVIEELRTQTKEARESADRANRLSRIALVIAIGSFAAACITVLLR